MATSVVGAVVSRKAQNYSSTTAYQMRLRIQDTGVINAARTQRQVKISLEGLATSPGGYQTFSSPKARITNSSGGTVLAGPSTVTDWWPRGSWITLITHTRYVDPGNQTFRGYFNSNTSAYDYTPLNGDWYATATLSVDAIPVAPTVNAMSISNLSDKSATATFSLASNGNASITAYGIEVSENSNMSSATTYASVYTKSITGLTPNKRYYVRGYATNAQGTARTAIVNFLTTFVNPGAPGVPTLTYNTTEPIPTSIITAKWSAASAGSTAIAGYRIRLFRETVQLLQVDTESTSLSYSFPSLDTYNIQPGERIRVGIYSYSKDWNGTKYLNGGGVAESQVFSAYLTIVSDKYIWLSDNGGAFTKRKMYISVLGTAFVEIKKEKFKVIK